MNKKYLIFLVLSVLISCGKDNKTADIPQTGKNIIYFFHPEARCKGCLDMESFTKVFAESCSVSEVKPEFMSINIDDKENEHYRTDYNLKFSSVVFSLKSGDKEIKWKNLDSIWAYSENEKEFLLYLDREYRNFIK